MSDPVIESIKPSPGCYLPVNDPSLISNTCDVSVKLRIPERGKFQLVFGYQDKKFSVKNMEVEGAYFLRALAKIGIPPFDLLTHSIRFHQEGQAAYLQYRKKHRNSDFSRKGKLMEAWKICVDFILVGSSSVNRLPTLNSMEKNILREQLTSITKQQFKHTIWQSRTQWLLKKIESR